MNPTTTIRFWLLVLLFTNLVWPASTQSSTADVTTDDDETEVGDVGAALIGIFAFLAFFFCVIALVLFLKYKTERAKNDAWLNPATKYDDKQFDKFDQFNMLPQTVNYLQAGVPVSTDPYGDLPASLHDKQETYSAAQPQGYGGGGTYMDPMQPNPWAPSGAPANGWTPLLPYETQTGFMTHSEASPVGAPLLYEMPPEPTYSSYGYPFQGNMMAATTWNDSSPTVAAPLMAPFNPPQPTVLPPVAIGGGGPPITTVAAAAAAGAAANMHPIRTIADSQVATTQTFETRIYSNDPQVLERAALLQQQQQQQQQQPNLDYGGGFHGQDTTTCASDLSPGRSEASPMSQRYDAQPQPQPQPQYHPPQKAAQQGFTSEQHDPAAYYVSSPPVKTPPSGGSNATAAGVASPTQVLFGRPDAASPMLHSPSTSTIQPLSPSSAGAEAAGAIAQAPPEFFY
eukprot:TRINITY_DN65762_c13_g2_i1.p2 TRINITY_DN65762_c13_g2~~TRINITY_DN65762_c13_g2_i1.p2  ORF type:complete len:455 (-),score=76.55 TRINITY_DN65762_c13_g2_i1:1577-2941(-)